MAAIFVFLLLSTFSTVVAQQRSSNIGLGSSLTPSSTNSSWLSSSGQFAFGFYPQGNGFAIGVWFAQMPQHTIVWTANRDDSPLSSNATLLLTSDGRFIVQPTQDQEKPIANVSQSASWASMLDTGNFVLYNSNGEIFWQSFDSPTDTLLPGQRLLAGQELFSSVSETDHSSGIFRLKMQHDGNLVQYPIQTLDTAQYAYWGSGTQGKGDSVTLNLDENGDLYLLNGAGYNIKNLSTGATLITMTVFYRMTIDFGGIFRLYSASMDQKNIWSIIWESSTDNCHPKGICGLNAYCALMDQQAECNCIPGFNFIDETKKYLGCQANLSAEDCGKEAQNSSFASILENTEWEDEDTYSVLSSQTEGECKEACMADVNCEVVTFIVPECRKQKLPLGYGRRIIDTSTPTVTFVKIGKSCSSPTPGVIASPTPGVIAKESKQRRPSKGILIMSLAFTASALIILAFSGYLVYQYRVWAYKKISEQANNIGLVEEIGLRSFTYDELEKVTECFKEVVGRGAFSTVFKGTLSNGKRIVAVKRLDKVFDEREREFQAEMRVIAKTHHRNLVKLLGYCCDGPNRLLVYEYMRNGSLADILFKSESPPCWHERVGIALNIARGILYLHEECDTQIIHCDIKPQNILMDEYRCPKIADFGLSKLLNADQTRTETGIRGTRGYVAPEWHRNLPVTVKADVYSYGVVFLEIICCRRGLDMNVPEEEIILTDWVYNCFEADEIGKLVGDEEVDKEILDRMVRIAIWCIQDELSLRPSMKKVVLMLEGTVDVPIPPDPTYFLSAV